MVRAIVVNLVGTDDRRAKVVFDRYGQNSAVFDGRTDEQARNHAVSEALSAVIRDERYGPDWIAEYHVVDIP